MREGRQRCEWRARAGEGLRMQLRWAGFWSPLRACQSRLLRRPAPHRVRVLARFCHSRRVRRRVLTLPCDVCPIARRCSSSAHALRPAVSSGPDLPSDSLQVLPASCVPDGMVCVLALCSPRRDGHVPTGARSLVASARATGCLPHRHVEDSAADPVWRAGAVSGLTAGVCSAEGQRPPASLLGRSWSVSCEPAAGLPDCIQGL